MAIFANDSARLQKLMLSSLPALLLSGVSGVALAQTAPAEQATSGTTETQERVTSLEEIVVTARRREESLQDAPIAVSSFSAAAIDRQFVTDIRGLAGQIPNVVITNVPGFNAAAIGIRGQSTADIILTFEPAVGVIVDDFVLANVQSQLFDLFDTQRIEVLRGPQGTLFGKNTVGGVINIITKRPTNELGGELRLGYSSFNTKDVKAAINIPLIDEKLALRVAGAYHKSGGYYHDTSHGGGRIGGSDVFNARAKLRFTPDSTTDIMLTYEIMRDRSDSPPSVNETPASFLLAQVGYPGIQVTGKNPLDTSLTLCEGNATDPNCIGTLNGHQLDVDGMYLRAQKDLPDIGSFIMVGGYRRTKAILPSEYSGEDAKIFYSTRDDTRKQYSVEGRFTSDFSDRLKFTVGGMYWGQKLAANATSFLGFLRFLGDPTATTDPNQSDMYYTVNSYSVFGEGEFKLLDKFALIAGGRYTKEDKTFRVRPQVRRSTIATGYWPEYASSASFSRPTFRAGYRWEINDNINNYFTYSQGYKSGGFNEQAMSATSALPFKEETADSFELGFKTETSDKRVRFNLAGFFVKYDNLQRDAVVPFTDPITGLPGQETRTTNAGAAEVWGVEAEASAVPVENLTVSLSAGWQDGKYNEFITDVNGDGVNDDASYLKLRNLPKWTLNGTATYDVFVPIGKISFTGSVNYQAEYEATTLNAEFTQGEARTLVGASINWSDDSDRYRVSIYGANLLNEIYRVNGNSVAGLFNFTNYAPPRSFGVEVGAKF